MPVSNNLFLASGAILNLIQKHILSVLFSVFNGPISASLQWSIDPCLPQSEKMLSLASSSKSCASGLRECWLKTVRPAASLQGFDGVIMLKPVLRRGSCSCPCPSPKRLCGGMVRQSCAQNTNPAHRSLTTNTDDSSEKSATGRSLHRACMYFVTCTHI